MKNTLYYLVLTLLIISCKEKNNSLYQLKPSKSTGITFNNKIIETDSFNIITKEYIFNGGGVAVGDFNNDNLPDLYFTGNQESNKLYLNNGDLKFQDVSIVANIEAKDKWSTGVVVVDINNDDLLDIYVCAAMSNDTIKRANMLFVHQGLDENKIPKFKEMALEYGIADIGNSMGATFFDYDNDGFLDLYVLNNEQAHKLPTNYRPKINDGSAISNDRLYHNNGNNTFTDVTIEAGIIYEGFGLGIAVADLNYDGWPDIHISNDYLTNDLLYINNGDGTFSNNIKDHIKHQSKFSMGSDISDYNNDGFLDLITLDMLGETNYRMKTTIGHNDYINYVLNDRWDYEYQYSRNMLHKGNGFGVPYSEIGLMAGVSKTDWSWSPLFMDADNDGFKDLFITNGFPRDITDRDFGDFRISVSRFLSPARILDSIPVVKIPNYAYKNKGDGTFKDVGEYWGLNVPSFSNGAVFADLDNDGDLDYVVNNINEEAFVFENTLNTNIGNSHFIKIDLKGSKFNNMGIGAKLTIRYGEQFQYYEHHTTRGYMSSVEDIVHFGLGSHNQIKSIEILWPDGKFQEISNLKVNQTISLAHDNAKTISVEQLSFPFVPKENPPMFLEVSNKLGIDYVHQEKDIIDYSLQRILPHKLSQNGPCVAVGDINGDGNEDFIVGSSARFSPVLFLQKEDGTFSKKELFTKYGNKKFEEEGMMLFDLENDGDLDLYMVTGSNEFLDDNSQYVDQLFINDGIGNFTSAQNKMPVVSASGSVVKAHDFDQDGFTDLFVGGRTPIGLFPTPEKSFLLKNNSGKLEDVTASLLPELKNIGMITDAVWADVDNDGLADLIVVGEYMQITIFKNNRTSFKKMEQTGLEDYLGWWETIVAEDFDNDGDLDFIVGNMGSNNFYQPSKEKPVTLLAKDFDDNGSIDPILFTYLKDTDGEYKSFPVNFWGDLYGQSPLFRSKFDFYKDYASTTQENLLTEQELDGAMELVGNYDKSSYIENLGQGKFKLTSLPMDAQIAPINGITITDFDEDGIPDILLIGNDYGNEIFIGRYDALNGLLLKGTGKGEFEPIKPINTGFLVPGDAKTIAQIKNAKGHKLYIITQNRGEILVYKKSE